MILPRSRLKKLCKISNGTGHGLIIITIFRLEICENRYYNIRFSKRPKTIFQQSEYICEYFKVHIPSFIKLQNETKDRIKDTKNITIIVQDTTRSIQYFN